MLRDVLSGLSTVARHHGTAQPRPDDLRLGRALLLALAGFVLLALIRFPSPAAAGFTPTPTPPPTHTPTPTSTPTSPPPPPPPTVSVTPTPTPIPLLPESGGIGGWPFPLLTAGGMILLIAAWRLSRSHSRRA